LVTRKKKEQNKKNTNKKKDDKTYDAIYTQAESWYTSNKGGNEIKVFCKFIRDLFGGRGYNEYNEKENKV
jgi:hypothetical protein